MRTDSVMLVNAHVMTVISKLVIFARRHARLIQWPIHVVAIHVKMGVHAEVKITVPRSVFTSVILNEGNSSNLYYFHQLNI